MSLVPSTLWRYAIFKGTLSCLKYHILKLWLIACCNSALLCWNINIHLEEKKKNPLRRKILVKGSKLYQNGCFDFFTSCPKINCNSLPSLQFCTPSSKHLFYLVLGDLFNKFIHVFGDIWQYNEEISKIEISMSNRDSVPLNC